MKQNFRKILIALVLCGICSVPVISQAMFNSELAYNPNYRPTYFGMGSEQYVDLSSVYTIENSANEWRFNVNMFSSHEDSGVISNTYTVEYEVNKKNRTARVNYGHGWRNVNFVNPNHSESSAVNAVNFCYAYFFGEYLHNNQCTYNMGQYYKG